MSVSYGGDKITFEDGSTVGSGWAGFKNRIINGAMVVDQRNAGASVTIPSATTYSLDRFYFNQSQASKYSFQQNAGSVTPPVGFTNYLGVTSSSAYSITSSDYFNLGQNIEGYNVADLGWGTANAQSITISFWVRSSLTGIFGVSLRNDNADRNYQASYTVSSANTWEQKTITVAGDTTGTWTPMTTNAGLRLGFGLGVGSNFTASAGAWGAGNKFGLTGATSVVGTNGATFYITGVQLERGSTASSFEWRPFGTELQLCQRYFEQWDAGSAYCPIPTAHIISGPAWTLSAVPRVQKRTVPTVSLSNSSGSSMFSSYGTNASGAGFLWSGSLTVDTGSSGNMGIQIDSTLSGTGAGSPGSSVHNILRANQWIRFSAEI